MDLERAEKQVIKLPAFVGLWRKQGNLRKKHTFASLTVVNPLTLWITTNWKILKEMRIADHLICLLRNLYVCQEVTLGTLQGTMDWFKIGKGVQQGCIYHPVKLKCRVH